MSAPLLVVALSVDLLIQQPVLSAMSITPGFPIAGNCYIQNAGNTVATNSTVNFCFPATLDAVDVLRTGCPRLFLVMQAGVRRWFGGALVVVGSILAEGQLMAQAEHQPRQGQMAAQFLHAVLRADYPAAYARLAPEVRQNLSLTRFEAVAHPLWKSGQRRGPAIELYKLGMRLGDRGASRLFYAFAFAADSSLKTPSELLEVTFRDTASRAVLGFGVHATAVPAKKKASVKSPVKRK